MASDASPGAIAGISPVLSSQASGSTKFQPPSGKILPQSGDSVAAAAATASQAAGAASQGSNSVAPPNPSASVTSIAGANTSNASGNSSSTNSTAASSSDAQALVNQINKYLNDSGQADQFRLDPDSSSYIQQVNPASGAVVAQYAVSEFPALARSIGASGLLIDDTA
jgi:hypothetical protein